MTIAEVDYVTLYWCAVWLLEERARELADVVGGQALSLDELSNFHPETDMILANTTSIGMQPKVDDTPISKVCLLALLVLDKTTCYWIHVLLVEQLHG